MAGDDSVATRDPDLVRAVVPGVALAVVVVAALADPAGWVEFGVLIVAAAGFALWARWPGFPLLALTLAVIAAVVTAQAGGELEPSMFLVSLLAIVIAGWPASTATLAICGLAALASPLVVLAVQPEHDFGWSIWMMGIAFPALIGLVFRRQEALSSQLADARRQLAEQAIAEERRRIARDVHDLVGHGLAAMLLQVTSARHVLRRDADSAEEALLAAETVGRQSMHELRRTVALLRSDEEDSPAVPLPGLAELGSLVDAARAGGLAVEYSATGEYDGVDASTGLAVYRIAQEALVNATRHAPHARTTVSTSVHGSWLTLAVESVGTGLRSRQAPDAAAPGYGIQGMRERAEAAGGTLQAGPTAEGWVVRCRIPVTRAAGEADAGHRAGTAGTS